MTTGRPPVRPYPGHRTPTVSGLGDDKRKVEETVDGNQFLCGVCNDHDVIFGVDDGADEELKASDEGEQAARIAPLPTQFQATLSQCLDHCVTHYPYQSWCPYCVEGWRREFGHSRVMKESSATPTISFDYTFLGDGEEVETQEAYEAAGESAVKLLVVRDNKTKRSSGTLCRRRELTRRTLLLTRWLRM